MELPAATVTYDYDDFYRVSYDVEINGSDILTTDYTFIDGVAENSTTILVESMTNAGNGWSDTLSYTYDCKGNIETISENGEQKAKYYYDELNQLVREDNVWLGKTIAYTYDNGGNILSVDEYTLTSASDISSLVASSTDVYAYTDSNWKDKLTAFNGNAITYDEIGNPLNYYNGFTFDWQNGRQLAGVSSSDLSISYKYNANGIRTEKSVNGVTTHYTLEGSDVVKESNGTDTIWYYYDASGSLTGFELNGTPYFYVSNIQGDITAIANADGEIVVKYTYDSWGKLVTISGTLADTVGIKNPFRYRGYYYDTETGLYYLNSRYYDPTIKRFINADGYVSTGQGLLGNNMFAYCGNNPVDKFDLMGKRLERIVGNCVKLYAGVCCDNLKLTHGVGTARKYKQVKGGDESTPNCYAFATGSSSYEIPGQVSGRFPTNYNDVRDVAKSVEMDFKAKGNTVRYISGSDSLIFENEYRIALRVGTGVNYFYGGDPGSGYDCHFMVQTSTGQWAEKHGTGESSILWDYGETPDTIPWKLGIYDYYDSEIIYLAIGG